MKNSTAPNRKTGRMIAKNLIVLFTVALAGFCGIQAWFTDKSSAEADGINVECQAPDGIEIAVVKHGATAPAPTPRQAPIRRLPDAAVRAPVFRARQASASPDGTYLP